MHFDYALPSRVVAPMGGEQAIRDRIDTILQKVPELQLEQLAIDEKDGEFLIHLEVSTDSMLSLADLPERQVFKNLPPAASKLAGTFEFEIDGTDIVFDRHINMGSALGFAALVIPPEERNKRRTTYIIHLPAAAKTQNATRTQNQGRTMIWDLSLGDALASPTHMSFVAPLPIPWIALVAAALILILALVLTIRWLRKRRARRRGEPTVT